MSNYLNPYEPTQSDPGLTSGAAPAQHQVDHVPVASFQYVLGDQWFQAVQRRTARATGEGKLFWRLIAGVVSIGVVAIVLARPPDLGLVLFMGAVIGGGIAFIPIAVSTNAKEVALKKFRRWKTYGATVNAILYRDRFVCQTPLTNAALRWETFSWAARFPDGYLLIAEGQTYWLYIVDMTSGRVDDVDAVLRANIADYKEIRA